ncbi:uncharacterized protein LOC128635364 isoform X2 [Ictalurus punctatus]|uniref:Uncharacterized protein LOC128635364 isoform X2 n=1 Tax=Ictalurus punctatus TaxID=7998 RepID=A0A9F7RNR6_ICTPU|nr:uncharacterized protein LOC128635364 isoform X2 [Ictalurus punctatus]
MVGFPQIPLLHHYYVYSLKLNKEVTILTERESESTQEHDAPDQLSTSRTKRLKSCPMTHRHTTFKWQDLSCIQRKAEYISKLTHSRLTRLTIDWLGRRAYLHATGSISKSNSMCGIQEVMECEQMLFGETKRCANDFRTPLTKEERIEIILTAESGSCRKLTMDFNRKHSQHITHDTVGKLINGRLEVLQTNRGEVDIHEHQLMKTQSTGAGKHTYSTV